MAACPPADTLSRFLLDVLRGEELAELETHVETCGKCQATLHHLSRLADGPTAEGTPRWPTDAAEVNLPAGTDQFLEEVSAVSLAAAARLNESPAPGQRAGDRAAAPNDRPQIDGYEVLDELGQGGMGIVYRARHLALNRLVALKMVLAGPVFTPQARQRFQQEGRAVGRLHHPNIIQVYDVGEQAGRPYLAMELVDGGSLARRVGGHPQPPRPAARLIKTLARAIHYAHTHGVVHRDLKPANILLASGGCEPPVLECKVGPGDSQPLFADLVAKIADFGLAKDLVADAPALTESGALLGTPSYMAPEQARGRGQDVGPAADIYALGAILYELLTGRPPFRAATALDTLVQVAHAEPVPIVRLQAAVPRDLATVCLKCLEKEPAQRYSSAADLADDLRRFLADEPTIARPIGAVGRARRWSRRNPAMAGALVTTVVAALTTLALGGALWQWREAVGARTRADALAMSEAQAHSAAQLDREAAVEARGRAERAAVDLLMDRGLSLCEAGETTAGMLSLARGLDQAAKTRADNLEFALRANIAAWAGRTLVPCESPPQGASLTGVTFTADGRRVLTSRWGNRWGKPGPGEAQMWELHGMSRTDRKGKAELPNLTLLALSPAGKPLHDPNPLLAAACSPDGDRVVTCSSVGEVRVWDVAAGAELSRPFLDAGRAWAIAVSAVGRRCVVGGVSTQGGGLAQVYDLDSGQPLGPPIPHPGRVNAVAFSPDGDAIVTGCSVTDRAGATVGGEARIWDAATGIPRCRPLPHARAVTAIAISPTGRMLVTCCADRLARLWDWETGRPIGVPYPHPFSVETVAFSPDGKTIVTGGGLTSAAEESAGALIWNVATGKPATGILSHPSAVHGVAVSPDGRFVATACRDGRVRLYDISGLPPLLEQRQPVPVSAALFSPDDRFLLTGGGQADRGQAQLWLLATGGPAGPAIEHDNAVIALAFNPAGRTFLTGSRDGAIRVRDIATGQPAGPPLGIRSRLASITVRPDFQSLATVGTTGTVRICNIATGQLSFMLTEPPGKVPRAEAQATALDAAGRILAVFRRPGPAQLFDVSTGLTVGRLLGQDKVITAMIFSPDGRTVLAGDVDGRIRTWDAATGNARGPSRPVGRIPFHLAYSGDGSRFLTVASSDLTRDWARVQLWDAATLNPLGPPLPQRVAIPAAAFHPGGRIIAAGGRDGVVRLWDVATGRPVGPPLYHTGAVRAVAFDSAGCRLAVTGADGSIRVWPVPVAIGGSAEEVHTWVEELTGHVLDPGGGV